MTSKLAMLSISDIHLGHPNVPTEFILENLYKYIPDNSSMAEIDIIWLCGDVFDQILYFSDTMVGDIERWIIHLLHVCKKWNICLRVLEGTPSHDRGQSIHFTRKAKLFSIDIDVKYIDTLSIEYIEKFDIHVLYVPDEYHATTDKTWYAVQELLLEHNIQKVDYAVMHGMFEHQLPSGLKLPFHSSERYLSIVKKYIFIGHIHQCSHYERILSNGSFDRLCQGEEEDKGFWKVISYKEDFSSDEIIFVINKEAKIFKTISWLNKSPEVIQKDTKKICDSLKEKSFLRIEMLQDPILQSIYDKFKKEYTEFYWDSKIIHDKNSADISVSLITYQPIPININTIESLVVEKMNYLGVREEKQKKIIELLQKIK